MEAPASGSPCSWRPLLRIEGGASMALGWGPLKDSAGVRHLWGSVGSCLLPIWQLPPLPPAVIQVGLQLPAGSWPLTPPWLGSWRPAVPVGPVPASGRPWSRPQRRWDPGGSSGDNGGLCGRLGRWGCRWGLNFLDLLSSCIAYFYTWNCFPSLHGLRREIIVFYWTVYSELGYHIYMVPEGIRVKIRWVIIHNV